MQSSTKTWCIAAGCAAIAAWLGFRLLTWFGPSPQSQSSIQRRSETLPNTKALPTDAAVGVLVLTPDDLQAVSTAVNAKMTGQVPASNQLGAAVVARLEVLRAGDWESYVRYVSSASSLGAKADMSLRDKDQWQRDMMYWSSAMLFPERAQAHIASRKEQVLWSRSSGSTSTRSDDGLYSDVARTSFPELVVTVEIPALVLDTIPMDKHVEAALTMDFVFVGGKWVPWKTGVWFPPEYDNPGIPPWL